MSQRMPEHQMTSVPNCNQMVAGGGVMSYRCTLPQSHHKHGPADDREPCFAVESGPATRAWQAWRERQDARDDKEAASQKQSTIDCPSCGKEQAMVLTEEDGVVFGRCYHCGEVATQQPQSLPAEDPTENKPVIEWDGWKQIIDPTRCPECRSHVRVNGARLVALPPNALVRLPCCGASAAAGYLRDLFSKQIRDSQQEAPSEPTKQREGDQRLPDGGSECVQDIVIAAMEESKRVGTERYGQPLMTFNGRKGFQDLVEEARDFFVYASMIQREAEADREALIGEVSRVLEMISKQEAPEDLLNETIAAKVVDRIMGYVVGRLAEAVKPE